MYFLSLHTTMRYQYSIVPNSCGTSWQSTVMESERPLEKETAYAAPIARPSAKLCMPSPIIIIQARDLMSVNEKEHIREKHVNELKHNIKGYFERTKTYKLTWHHVTVPLTRVWKLWIIICDWHASFREKIQISWKKARHYQDRVKLCHWWVM